MFSTPRKGSFFRLPLAAFLVLAATTATASAQPAFQKVFSPDSIGPSSTSELVFTITNGSATPVTDMAFSDTLPADVVLQTPAAATTDCVGATLTAPDGDSTITFSDGSVPGSQSCTVRVLVTAAAAGTYVNTSGDLTSSAGNSGTASDTLNVLDNRPGFSKSFADASLLVGETTTLTFDIDTSAIASNAFNVSFTDSLPAGLVVATPPNATVSCIATFAPTAGGTSVSLFSGFIPAADAGCTATVDITATAFGTQLNRTTNLTSSTGNSGFAVDTLDVTVPRELLTKRFVGSAVPGGTVTLEFTLTNFDRDFAATDIEFTDDLDAVLSGLTALGLPLADPCGAGSQLTGTSVLTFTGGSLPPEGSCTFSVDLQIPAGATPGDYPNTTSSPTATVDGGTQTFAPATDTLPVDAAPVVNKIFLDNPVLAGTSTNIEFTVTNSSPTEAATAVTFEDPLDSIFTATGLPASPCGGGSTVFVDTSSGTAVLTLINGSLPAGGSCTFQIPVTVAAAAAPGTYPNRTTAPTATVAGETVVGVPGADDLLVIGAPDFAKSFSPNAVAAGATVDLEFTLSLNQNAPTDVTGIAFTDDLGAVLAGLTAVGLPLNNVCGAGSQITGTTTLSFTGGTLAPGESCTFTVTVQVPAGAAPGTYPNTTSSTTSMTLGETVVGPAASDDLIVNGVSFSKSFTDDPVIAGATVTLEFTISNLSGTETLTGLFFTDDLGDVLAGLTSTDLPQNDVCGAGSLFSQSGDTLQLGGGTLGPGASCTFSTVLQVPVAAPAGVFGNRTSSLASFQGVFPAAQDDLTVAEPLSFTKTFTDDPVSPGDPVTLEFSIFNADADDAITGISFTDDLDAALSGLVATGLPLNNVCGAGSQISGTSTLSFTGGSLAAGSSCTFQVTLQVPAGAALGTVATNTTSSITGTLDGLTTTGDPATDDLELLALTFSKSFDGPTAATGTAVLSFSIANLSATDTASGLSFTDDLDAVLTGLVATGLPQSDVCGTGSLISGTSLLTVSGGTLPPNGTCTIMVTVQVPAGATPGTFPNTSSDLFQSGVPVAEPATADLVIEPPPTFAKTFAPDSIGVGAGSTLTFAIDNTASTLAASDLAFTDVLPAGLAVATPANVTNTCGGTVTATSGTDTISLSGGTVAAGASCQIQVDVTANLAGALINTTGDLTSSSGNSGTASDTLVVNPQPGFAKAFAPATVPAGTDSTLTFTIDNSPSTVAATGLDFTDNLPAGLVVASPSNASTTCTGGTLTAVSGGTTISYSGGTVAAGTICTVQTDVTTTAAGTFVNTSGNLTSSLGNSGPASDSLTATLQALGFAKAFAPNPIASGGVSTLTFNVDNSTNQIAVGDIDFTDNLPTGMTVASPANASTTCSLGTVTASAGAGTVSFTGGRVPASATCTVSVDVTSSTPGEAVNVSGDLTSEAGNSGTATDTLRINPQPGFTKAFAPDAIPAGTVSTLTFTVDNSGSTVAATALDFTDNLPAGVVVATPANAATTCTGGTLTAVAGSAVISYTGGTVVAAATCTVQADVTTTAAGSFDNISGDLTSSLGNSGSASDTLTATLEVLGFSKDFSPAVIQSGGVSTLTFTIDNAANQVDVGAIAFTDNLPAGMTVASPANASTTCSPGTVTAVPGAGTVTFAGGQVATGGTCTVSVDVTSATLGDSVNVSDDLTSEAGNSGTATATLTVIDDLGFTKSFLSEPVLPGGAVDVEFTLTNPSPDVTLMDLAFTVDFDAALAGMVVESGPMSDICGAGSQASGSPVLTFSGGTLAPAASCTFAVSVRLPADAAPGTYPCDTSTLTGTANGKPVSAAPASDDLEVAGLVFSKDFGAQGITPGQSVQLSFSIANPDPVNDATGITFSDDLEAFIPGATTSDVPQFDVCGTGSLLDGPSFLTLTGGTLGAGETCTFTVLVDIPSVTPMGDYTNVTSTLDAEVGGETVVGATTQATLTLGDNILAIPTLGQWGLLLLALGLGWLGIVAMRRSA
ncbi:MAG: IPTL-CTERM sorting domain-containing protein [Acidobacteriota bacterium]